MSFNTSAVSVCCSSASLKSSVRWRSSLSRRVFSIAMTACAAKFWTSSISFSVNGVDPGCAGGNCSEHQLSSKHGSKNNRFEPEFSRHTPAQRRRGRIVRHRRKLNDPFRNHGAAAAAALAPTAGGKPVRESPKLYVGCGGLQVNFPRPSGPAPWQDRYRTVARKLRTIASNTGFGVWSRSPDRRKNFAGGGLLFERLGQFAGALAQLVEQAGVLDGDRRLIGERREQRDVLVPRTAAPRRGAPGSCRARGPRAAAAPPSWFGGQVSALNSRPRGKS